MLGTKGHKGKRRHPAFRCAQTGVSLGIAEALAGDSVSLRSTGPVHPLARAPYRPGLTSRWGSMWPGSAPRSLALTQGAQAAAGGDVGCVSSGSRWGSSLSVSSVASSRRAPVSWPSRLICPRDRGHVRSRRRELKPPAEALLQPCCRFSPTLPGPVDLPLADLLGDALRNPDDPGLVSGSLRPPLMSQ